MALKKNAKLRIAMLGHKRVPSREGGVEIVVEELSVRMAGLGYDVTCFNRRGHHVSGKEFDTEMLSEYKGVTIKSVFTVQKGGLAAVTSSVFAAIKAAFGKFDIIHFHAEGPCAMIWLPKIFGKRCIATIHGLDHQRAKWGRFASWYIRFGEKCAVKFADEIIVLSDNVQQYFKEKYNRDTVFIPNGVTESAKRHAEEITEKFGLKKDEYILFLGRLVPEKGIKSLIDAYKKVDTDKKLVIAGGSSDTDEFEKELKTAAESDRRILFTGFVQGKIWEELYSNAYIYVLPSNVEGMPLSLLEAMSFGNCCLTSDIPECSSVIKEYGLTFRKGDTEDLKNKLQLLCDDSSKTEWYKSNCAEYICDRYSWDDTVNKTLQLYGVTEDITFVSSVIKEENNESLVGK